MSIAGDSSIMSSKRGLLRSPVSYSEIVLLLILQNKIKNCQRNSSFGERKRKSLLPECWLIREQDCLELRFLNTVITRHWNILCITCMNRYFNDNFGILYSDVFQLKLCIANTEIPLDKNWFLEHSIFNVSQKIHMLILRKNAKCPLAKLLLRQYYNWIRYR